MYLNLRHIISCKYVLVADLIDIFAFEDGGQHEGSFDNVLLCWCSCKLSLVGWASSMRYNSGLSCALVCCFANNTRWLLCCFAKDSDSIIADCVSNKSLMISFFVFSSICKNFISPWSISKNLHWSLNILNLFSITTDNKSILLLMVETLHFKLLSKSYICASSLLETCCWSCWMWSFYLMVREYEDKDLLLGLSF